MKLSIKVINNIIVDSKFKAFGCQGVLELHTGTKVLHDPVLALTKSKNKENDKEKEINLKKSDKRF